MDTRESEAERHLEASLGRLGASRPVDALLELMPFLFPEGSADQPAISRRRARACEAALEVLKQLDAEELIALDSRLRQVYSYAWQHCTPAALPREASLRVPLLALLTSHRSGYAREHAVGDLAVEAPAFGFPFVLLRANDWVHAVRRIAAFGVSATIHASGATIVVDALPLVLKFDAFGRASHEELRTALRACLETPDGVRALDDLWSRNQPGARRTIVAFLRQSRQELRLSFVERASSDRDPVVRLWAAREIEALEAIDAAGADVLLGRMASDSSSAIRREALYGFVRRGAERAIPILTALVFDRARSVRHAARYYLRELGLTPDFAAQYRARLTGRVKDVVTAIAGLAETGSVADVPLLRQLLVHRSPKVAVALLLAIHRLDLNGSRLLLLEAMLDERMPVRRWAITMLPRRIAPADAQHIIKLVADAKTPVQRQLEQRQQLSPCRQARAGHHETIRSRGGISVGRLVRLLAFPVVARRAAIEHAELADHELVRVGVDRDLVGLLLADDQIAARAAGAIDQTVACGKRAEAGDGLPMFTFRRPPFA